jgi:carbonic anhydrase/acetyltransferase-like protein (isoleucine patch superfamily)
MEHLEKKPWIHPTAFVARGAILVGDVTLEEQSSVWYNCVLRGDTAPIRIGKRSNIQDLSLCHGVRNEYEVIVGDDVTVGHCAIVHACTVEDRCLIGMGAKILSGAVIGAESIIAAGAVVRERMVVPPRSLVVGLPGVVKKTLGDDDVEFIRSFGLAYLSYQEVYRHMGAEVAEWFV